MQDNYQPQPQAQLQTHVQKQEQKEVDSLKDELSRLNIKQLRLFGKDLNGLGLNELRLLEHQLNEGLLAIKDMKEEKAVLESETLRRQARQAFIFVSIDLQSITPPFSFPVVTD
uniref:Agamous-like MADS-box protein AGL15 n=2 Tax=Nicotiana TaxID=4085 RepID=A0A1S4B8Y4_TOBAC|nr:PREDICTED: agamous-like MADS-box protein AGL15 [Nicotiana sylvestris]XP_016485253.1 PREDICTED: agamous-like MADS-box protein AGL15 [Nicotiana tabacum]